MLQACNLSFSAKPEVLSANVVIDSLSVATPKSNSTLHFYSQGVFVSG